MYKNLMFIFSALAISFSATAHDGGHGPKIVKSGKYGGVLAKVSPGSNWEEAKNSKALYVAELVKDNEGKVSIYLYNNKMKPVKLDNFSVVKGKVESGRGKKAKSSTFSLAKSGMSFSGKLPKKKRRPFSVVVNFKEGSKPLFMAFDNLD